jgi:Coenzyme PQQ synthesis protein D (PqqD)
MTIELQECFQPNGADIAAKVIDGEAIILNIANGLYFSMGEVGALVWELIEVGCSGGEIRDALAARYDVDAATAGEDVVALLQTLLEEGLVQRTEAHGTPTTRSPAAARLPYVRPELHRYDDMVDLLALDPPMPGLGDTTWRDPSDRGPSEGE